jgi:hypothetical protein
MNINYYYLLEQNRFCLRILKISLKFLRIVTRTNPNHRRHHRHRREEEGLFSEKDSRKRKSVAISVSTKSLDIVEYGALLFQCSEYISTKNES